MDTRSVFKGKSIIVGLPNHYNIDQFIIKELRYLGFDNITEISFSYKTFRYRSIVQHAKSFLKKNFMNRPHYKLYLKFKELEPELINKMKDTPNADFVLLIRPDIYSPEFINFLKTKSDKIVGYQWDGLSRFPAVLSLISHFDRFFIFDPKDLRSVGVLPLTNFGSASLSTEELTDDNRSADIYFAGTYESKRMKTLGRMLSQFKILNLRVNCILSSQGTHILKKYNLSTTTKCVSFEENIKNAYNAKVIVDDVSRDHKGLSFRVFEALTYDKKLITTNREIMKYDFYHVDNIFVWTNRSSLAMLKAFIEKPYSPVNPQLKLKYNFQNWIKYVLDFGEYIPIDLPK